MATASTLYPERMQAPDNFDDWSEEHAKQLAREDGIHLDDAHWEVIYFLRNHCKDHGTSCTARHIIRVLSERFEDRGGKALSVQSVSPWSCVSGKQVSRPAHAAQYAGSVVWQCALI